MPEAQTFSSAKELAKLAAGWPAERLAEIHNTIAGVKPVVRFKDRLAGAARIWKALEPLAEQPLAETTTKADAAPTTRKGATPKAKATKKAILTATTSCGKWRGTLIWDNENVVNLILSVMKQQHRTVNELRDQLLTSGK